MRHTSIDVYDPVSSWGHARYNSSILGILAAIYNKVRFIAIDTKEFASFDLPVNVETHYCKRTIFRGRLGTIWMHYKFMRKAQLSNSPCIFICFENISAACACLLTMSKKKKYFICHNNFQSADSSFISKLSLKVLKFFKAQLIVLEPEFKAYPVKQLGFDSRSVATVYHPLSPLQAAKPFTNNKSINVLYLGGGCEKKGISCFISATKILAGSNIKFTALIHESIGIIPQQNITIVDEILDSAAYDNLLDKADIICLPYTNSFHLRCSASFFEALALGKHMVCSDIALFYNYKNSYGNIITLFKDGSVEDLARAIKQAANLCGENIPVEAVYNDRSNQVIAKQLISILT